VLSADPVFALDGEIKDDALLAAPQPAIPRVASRSTASLPLVVPRAWCNLASVGGGADERFRLRDLVPAGDQPKHLAWFQIVT